MVVEFLLLVVRPMGFHSSKLIESVYQCFRSSFTNWFDHHQQQKTTGVFNFPEYINTDPK